ncbi:MAG: hypothetical protein EYC70_16865 [Planctomycetota bacterium]|nr:MAG: hypothetical protein EYC70_16865 [Planctomycetota bacterium]
MITQLLVPFGTALQDAAGSSIGMDLLHTFIRWLHILAGIVWIGHLYFFNFVNANFAPTMDAETKRKVVPQLMPRALFWFRMGAATTWITGVLLFGLVYMMSPAVMQSTVLLDDGTTKEVISNRTWWILTGALFGTIMAYNVWFIIWPKQKRIITAVRDGQKPEDAWVKTATKASKVNTYLSVPLLLTMVSNSIPTLFSDRVMGLPNLAFLGVMIVIGLLTVYGWYKIAPGVKGF